jgi:hypothetical protein
VIDHLLDFDEIDDWAPKLAAALKDHVPDTVRSRIAVRALEYIEDARDVLFELADRDAIIDATLAWVRSSMLAGYHGTRLTDAEVDLVLAMGLLPLKAEARRDRLIRALSPHPRWGEVAGLLDETIRTHGQGERAGRREDQVHLTLSRSGLTNGFNHYLTHGAEFDQHVAHALLGQEGQDLLGRDGVPRVVQVAVPGAVALDAAHPFFDIDHLRANGDVPNVVDQFLKAWSYRLAHPGFQARTLEVDCGLFFRSAVPASWVVNVETLSG